MKCPKCGSKYITVVNRPIQLKEKTDSATMTFLITIAIIALIFGLICLTTAPQGSSSADISSEITNQTATYNDITPPVRMNSNTSFFKTTAAYLVGVALAKWSAISLLACGIINALRPHKMVNKLIGVCMECGHDAELNTFKETTETKTPGESKTE